MNDRFFSWKVSPLRLLALFVASLVIVGLGIPLWFILEGISLSVLFVVVAVISFLLSSLKGAWYLDLPKAKRVRWKTVMASIPVGLIILGFISLFCFGGIQMFGAWWGAIAVWGVIIGFIGGFFGIAWAFDYLREDIKGKPRIKGDDQCSTSSEQFNVRNVDTSSP